MRKFKIRKKTFKGMTLVEIIISLAIVAVMTTIIVGTAGAINKYTKASNNMDKRVAMQAPVAEAQYYNIVAGAPRPTESIEIIVNNNITVNGNVNYAFDDDEMQDNADGAGSGLNMRYITDISPS
ncbi:MAG: prepilin-type N-terminal cleavage/methylation domain-containing protein [Ruminococcus sp.]|nr:prepilin-type N-terminal cleavage/methylation domain-containing protein [Ruminococcus sp.]MDE7225326.1 prepilin-type N-terminal cleavage/methylation domain-containing protein [Ruminococcus sp.]